MLEAFSINFWFRFCRHTKIRRFFKRLNETKTKKKKQYFTNGCQQQQNKKKTWYKKLIKQNYNPLFLTHTKKYPKKKKQPTTTILKCKYSQ